MTLENSKEAKAKNPVQKSTGSTVVATQQNETIPDFVSEDVYRFWKENGNRVITYAAVLLVGVLAIQGWKYWVKVREDKVQQSYAQLKESQFLEKFAQQNGSHPLAGAAVLELANGAYAAGDMEKALNHFKDAAKKLDDQVVAGVARLGVAACLTELGKAEDASAILDTLAHDKKMTSGIRAEALFKRILLARKGSDTADTAAWEKELEALDSTGIWIERVKSIKNF